MKRNQVRTKRLRASRYLFAVCTLVPVMGVFLITRIIPMAGTLYNGLFKWNFGLKIHNFIGLKNYGKLFTSYLFHTAVKNTFILTFVSIFFTLAIALVLALVLNRRKMKHQVIYNIYEAILFLPFIR